MPKLSNANPYHSIYNSTISNFKPKYGEEFDYHFDGSKQEYGDKTFMGVTGRVGLSNAQGRKEGDDLTAPNHWDQVTRRTNGYSRNAYGQCFRGNI
jgi:hypothetical protein